MLINSSLMILFQKFYYFSSKRLFVVMKRFLLFTTDAELTIMKDGGFLELAKSYMSRLHNEQINAKEYQKN